MTDTCGIVLRVLFLPVDEVLHPGWKIVLSLSLSLSSKYSFSYARVDPRI